jgi:hypothetical protein
MQTSIVIRASLVISPKTMRCTLREVDSPFCGKRADEDVSTYCFLSVSLLKILAVQVEQIVVSWNDHGPWLRRISYVMTLSSYGPLRLMKKGNNIWDCTANLFSESTQCYVGSSGQEFE